ncbi:helix-turn-helix domain containing protein [Micromonospora sp. WMMD1128]|uniref:TetR/AcrR family transcriptional regulator n=1 Tax=Micromonospora sp. WMMD1128 TaxID=3015150 RepID=UPI00248BF00C|nr:TetR/AcrR family transcriptional regulator [Micromonospora sp. WMMD1128]WBB76876.1 helix-turn-helix domain containing protein [Micromonospora sp. WMMD1128]
MDGRHSTLREQRRAETQRMIQAHAVRLFVERGYDGTTVNDVAEAAGVSPMTVYRHFPTKEDLVLLDQNGPLVAERIAATPAGQPLVRRIGAALVDSARTLTEGDDRFLLARLRLMISTPALRARHLDNHHLLQQAIVNGLGGDNDGPEAAFHAAAAASACLAAMHTALVRWAEDDGRDDLGDLITQAFAAAFGDQAEAPGQSGAAAGSRRRRATGGTPAHP